jgi:hypothetical protein
MKKLAYAVAANNRTNENLVDMVKKFDLQLTNEQIATIFSKNNQVKMSDLLVLARSWMSAPV